MGGDADILSANQLNEKVESMEYMLEMTTTHLQQIQKDLSEKKEALEKYQGELMKSLYFSAQIQSFLQPSEVDISVPGGQAFILNKPRDVIGGDFIWTRRHGTKLYVACIDCTGHGVPGAMLTMAAYFTMNSVFDRCVGTGPAEFISELNREFYDYFHLNAQKDDLTINHGLDIGLVKIDVESLEGQYAGTHQRLLIHTGNNLKAVKGDNAYVGEKEMNPLVEHDFKFQNGDRLFMYTDGAVDQFGGRSFKKVLPKRFHNLIGSTSSLTLNKQKEIIESFIADWKGGLEQTDDILIIGMKL